MRMLPNPARLSVTIDGRTYMGEESVVYDGVAAQDVAELTANGWLSLPVVILPHGEMYATNVVSPIVISAANTPHQVTGNLSAGSLSAFTFDTNVLVAKVAGKYHLTWSLTVDTANSNDQIEGGVMLNGVAQEKGTSHTTIAVTSGGAPCAASLYLDLEIGDRVGLYVREHDGTNTINMQHASLTALLIG